MGTTHVPPHPDPTIDDAMQAISDRLRDFATKLYADFPAISGSMAIPGMLLGHGVGAFVAEDMTDDQIVKVVLEIAARVRRATAAVPS